MIRLFLAACAILVPFAATPLSAGQSPPKVKVYILAGQSNMEGHGQVRSLDRLGEHPEHGHVLAQLKAPDGSWAVRDDVTIAWASKSPAYGPLTVGWGYGDREIGPELLFGTIMGERHDAPVLLIKTAWGGKDVYCDFRSPSAGTPGEDEVALLRKQQSEGNVRDTGAYYRKMITEIKDCLDRLDEIVPGYEGQGYELEGMAWFQGWNDYCQWRARIDEQPVGQGIIDAYPATLAAMFTDLRRDLDAPDLPVVVGEMGVGGDEMASRAGNEDDREARAIMAFRRAQASAVEDHGLDRAVFVPTAAYWDDRLEELRQQSDDHRRHKQELGIEDTEENVLPTPELSEEFRTRGGHWYCHYNGSASNYSLVGLALAESLLAMDREHSTPGTSP
ncbi:MAG: sialate O-acetylesterase [Phycisphaerales bacterium]|nr:sialate O-acetylesterase [Phycisphaerales bacterium]